MQSVARFLDEFIIFSVASEIQNKTEKVHNKGNLKSTRAFGEMKVS